MAEEITRIMYDSKGSMGMKQNEVLNVFQYRKTHNLTTPIHLTLLCHNRSHSTDDEQFSETAEMRTAMLDNIVHINRFTINNQCVTRVENLAWFNYLLQFLRADHGGTKYVIEYRNRLGALPNYLSLEHDITFSDALRLHNNKGDITSFTLWSVFMNTEAFQTIWNAFIVMGIPSLLLSPKFLENREGGDNNNYTMNFAGLSTNTSVKRLYFNGIGLSQQNWRNLFLSIQGNTGLEKLKIQFSSHRSSLNNIELLPCFTEMLQKNSTLIDVEASNINGDGVQNDFTNVSTIETKLNRKWNQYLMKRKEEEEEENAAASTALPPPPLPAHVVAAVERKRRYKMSCLMHAFRNKVVMCDTVLFHFLSETPELLIDNEVQQNRVFTTRKRPRRKCGRYE